MHLAHMPPVYSAWACFTITTKKLTYDLFLDTGFLQVFCSKIPRLFPDFSSRGMTISLTLSKQ